jgi:hypothetical protein
MPERKTMETQQPDRSRDNVRSIKRQPSQQVIGLLKDALELAESGETIAITIMAEYVTELQITTSATDDLLKQLSHLSRMMHIIQRRIDGDFD